MLVTGGSGRLGRSVVATLAERAHEVVSVDLAPPPPGAADSLPADLTDPGDAYAAVARFRPQAIVHLAAIAVPFSRPEATILRTNAMLAFNVCQAAVDLGVESVVVAGSPTVMGYGNPLGWRPRYLPLDEDHPVTPWNAYGLSKLVSEETVAAFARQVGDRVRFSVFRPGYVIAPEEWRGAPTQQGHTVAERLARPELAAPALFNYVDARDAADLVDTLLRRAPDIPNAEVFFACAADALACAPLAELLVEFHPDWADQAAGLTGTSPAFSIAKAERLLGWRPARTWRCELQTDDQPPTPAGSTT